MNPNVTTSYIADHYHNNCITYKTTAVQYAITSVVVPANPTNKAGYQASEFSQRCSRPAAALALILMPNALKT